MIDWTITALLSVIGSVILSVAGNLLTEPIKNWFDNRSLVNTRKRVDQLQKEYDFIAELHNNRNMFYSRIFHDLFTILQWTILGIAGITSRLFLKSSQSTSTILISAFIFLIGIIVIYIALFFTNKTILVTRKVYRFDEYKENVEKRIGKLNQRISNKSLPPSGQH